MKRNAHHLFIIDCNLIQQFNIIDVLVFFRILSIMPGQKEKSGKSYKTKTVIVASEHSINLQHRVSNLEEQFNVLQAKAANEVKCLHKEIHEIKEQAKAACDAVIEEKEESLRLSKDAAQRRWDDHHHGCRREVTRLPRTQASNLDSVQSFYQAAVTKAERVQHRFLTAFTRGFRNNRVLEAEKKELREMLDHAQELCTQKDEAIRLLKQEAIVNDLRLNTRHEQLEVNNQLLALIRRDNETLKTAMVDMLDDIRRLNAIAGETGGWADVLL